MDGLRSADARAPGGRASAAGLSLVERLRSRTRRAGRADAGTSSPESAELVSQLVEESLIPHLIELRPAPRNERVLRLEGQDLESLLRSVLFEPATATLARVRALNRRGVALETILLELVPTVARRLGDLWDRDLCDFAQVTIGLCRLHEVVRELSIAGRPGARLPDPELPRVILATALGDPHILGIVLVAETFRRAGWRVRSEPGARAAELGDILEAEHFDVMVLSAFQDASGRELAREIAMLRAASRNRELRVLVGGRLFQAHPERVAESRADGAAGQAEDAPAAARRLLNASPRGLWELPPEA